MAVAITTFPPNATWESSASAMGAVTVSALHLEPHRCPGLFISRVSLRFIWSWCLGLQALPLCLCASVLSLLFLWLSCQSISSLVEQPRKTAGFFLHLLHPSWGCLESSLSPKIHKNRKLIQVLFLYSQGLTTTWLCFFSVTAQCL